MQQLADTELYRQIVETSSDAILFADPDGRIRLWNAGAVRLFGFSAEEALGESLDIIIPEKLRKRHWGGYHRVMQIGESRYHSELLSVPALHRAGHQLSCEFSIVMIRNDANEICGFAAIMRDVTARWEQERTLREKLRVLEGDVR